MKTARVIFALAGIWGLAALLPFYFGYQMNGQPAPQAVQPEFYYGFLGVTVAWQIAFLLIAADPARFRPLMLVAMVEKFLPAASIGALVQHGHIAAGNPFVAGTVADVILGLLFVWAFVATRGAAWPQERVSQSPR